MKKVLILFGKSDWGESRPFKNKNYQYSYEHFYSLCQDNGIEIYRASYQWYDYEKHIFKYAWVYKGENGNWAKVKNISPDLITGDSTKTETFEKVKEILKNHKKKNIQLAILHPPYADIIKFSDLKDDLSNAKSLKDFLEKFSAVLKNTIEILENSRYLVIVIGDKYSVGKWIPLGFYCMNEAQKLGLTLKSVIIKNIAGNRAKQNKEAIWRYRALSSDYYIFKHEYILIFKNI